VASPTSSAAARSTTRLIVLVIILALLLLGLGILYWMLTKPPTLDADAAGSQDRDYLFSIYGFEGDLLRRPSSVAVDPQGNIYVADTGKHRIVVFDSQGNFVTTYGESGEGQFQIQNPIDVAVAPDGRSYVLDKNAKKIVIYDSTKQPVDEVVFADEYPLSLTINDERLFVTTESGLVVGGLDGEFVTGYIRRGQKPGDFDKPGGVTVGPDGTMYIADSFNYRVQAISNKGEPLWQYGQPIPPDQAVGYQGEERKFGLPASITIDENGLLYVVDGTSSEIIVLDSADGSFVERIGDVGHEDGTFYYPDGIDYFDGKLVVADKFNDRIEIFRVPQPVGSQLAQFAPWALLLLLIPLLLLLFLLRRTRYVLTPEFLGMLQTRPDGPEVAGAIKRVVATRELAQRGAEMEDVPLKWNAKDFSEEKVDEFVAAYEVTAQDAEALALADALRGKRVLLAESPATRSAATELEVPTLSFDEILAAVKKDAGPEPMGAGAE
jgi:sugar lactone lactonase YvrE